MLGFSENILARISSMLILCDTAQARVYDELFEVGIPNG